MPYNGCNYLFMLELELFRNTWSQADISARKFEDLKVFVDKNTVPDPKWCMRMVTESYTPAHEGQSNTK